MTSPSPVQAVLEALHARFAGLTTGQVADYIPELSKVDPALFGIAIATVDGQVYEVGDSRHRFTIQSVSKPLVYGAALAAHGASRVQQAIGLEPSGEAFNSISLEPGTGRPLNPMINAGAIAAASLVPGDSPAERLAHVLRTLSAYAGRELDVDEAVYASERDTGHRNRAIGHLLRNYGILPGDPEPVLDLYFRQCAVRVDCRDLALVGATLANGGVNPVTQTRALPAEHLRDVLSVMATSGVYDFTGEWIYRVGMPAKSGVGGGIVAVLPGQLGIGVFSPAVDERGNSARGVKVCEALSGELGLHMLLPPRASQSSVRARYTLERMRSERRRPPAESALLDSLGRRALVLELQGDLRFTTIEPVVRDVLAAGEDLRYAVMDFKRVSQADAAATRLLARLAEQLGRRGGQLMLTRVRREGLLADLGGELAPHHARSAVFHPHLDQALEACENGLLASHAQPRQAVGAVGLAANALCLGLSAQDLDYLSTHLVHQSHEPGTTVVRAGEPADALYLVLEGEASVVLSLPGGGLRRLATVVAGMSFGEAALEAGGVRTADVRADRPLLCALLHTTTLAQIERERPAVAIRLLRNLLRASAATMARLTGEVAALEG